MSVAKISFIISMVSLLLMIVTFGIDPIIISGVAGLPGEHVFIFFAVFVISLLISILSIIMTSISDRMNKSS